MVPGSDEIKNKFNIITLMRNDLIRCVVINSRGG